MLNHLESDYDCANAGEDLHQLIEQLASLEAKSTHDQEEQEHINRLQNQIHFIRSKCRIH
ncbi:DUF2524 domain-containing protein [Paenibacillus contaminans]|uniref:DUF2524 domain-containing protein n=1 Tax=Paenibacillus contaminans TaxID=450362 RepID=A0A329MGW1_9BACL|nr:DUF2524 domain-containing protein [Paenibacillus contaminans]RAV18636.1 DUF2524 domain-containing protein [Paenibacillus contaminans]